MFDTMTFTKILGGFCGALLVFLLGKWAAEGIYAMGGGHGGDDHGPAYVIDTGGDEDADVAEEEVKTFAELYGAADIDKGERVFNKCKACHQVEDGVNGAGPHLYAVVGRDVGAVGDFGYSGVLSEAADVWTPEELDAFLTDPGGYAPGTSMGFSGLNKIEDRVNVIAYLDMTDGDMTELAMDEAAAEPEAETEMAATEEATESAAEAVTADEPEVAEVEATPEAEAVAEDATEEATEEVAAAEEATEEEAAAEEATEEMAATEEVTEEAAAEAEPAAAEDSAFAALVAAADPADGEKVYRKCQACHVVDDAKNRVGPHLVGLMGREIGGVDGFRYSSALADMDGVWNADNLSDWLEDPKGFAPGNKMSFRGLPDEADRAAVIAYIQSAGQ